MCGIEFVHPGVIDIEQLSFVSRQHVVAYWVGGSALINSPPRQRNGNGTLLLSLQGGGGNLKINVKCGITLNVQYPPPIVASSAALVGGPASLARNNNDDLISDVMQLPVLYSASASLDDTGDNESTGQRRCRQLVMPSRPLISRVAFRGRNL